MVKAYVLLKVKVGTEREVFEKLNDIHEVIDADELYGEWDIIAKLEVGDYENLDTVLTEKVRPVKGVECTSTMLVAEYKL